MIKHIIFDFGGVLLDLGKNKSHIPSCLAQVFNIPLEEAILIWQENKEDLILGNETAYDFVSQMKNKLNLQGSEEELLKAWKKVYVEQSEVINYDLLTYIEKLKKKYKVYVLTDTIDLGVKHNWSVDVDGQFTRVFKSFEEHVKKPNAEAFTNVLSKINSNATECIFVDDKQVNVDAAKALGFHAFVYTTPKQLYKDFESLRISELI